MKKLDIIAAIESKRGTTEYNIWRIGLTHDVAFGSRVISEAPMANWIDLNH